MGTSTYGGTAKPIYWNAGVPVAISATVGSGTQPAYLSSGTITACGTTVGSSTKGIYSNAGVLTAMSTTVGGSTAPIYCNGGTLTACSGTYARADTSQNFTGLTLNKDGGNTHGWIDFYYSGSSSYTSNIYETSSGLLHCSKMETSTNTDYTTQRLRNIAFATSTPSSISNGNIVMVYS